MVISNLAADEVADGDQRARRPVSASAGLGRLDQAVHAFDRAVGEPGIEDVQDPVPVRLDRRRKSLERLQSATP